MKVEINIDLENQNMNDCIEILYKSIQKELEKEKNKKIENLPAAGYGYYIVTEGCLLGNDEWDNNRGWSNHLSTGDNAAERIEKYRDYYRRKIEIPKDYILVPEGDLIKEGYMCINPTISMNWVSACTGKMLKGYTYCKPIFRRYLFRRIYYI